jgi:chromosomal replication initiator protein
LSGFIATPETRLALAAVRRLAAGLRAGRLVAANPLFLHGPPGSGKSHLADGLVAAVADGTPTARLLAAADFAPEAPVAHAPSSPDALDGAAACDLLIVEDLQHLPTRAADTLTRLVDQRLSRRRPFVVTAGVGPAQLTRLPARLTSRLSAGLVVGLEPLSAASRRTVLGRLARRRDLRARPEVLDWLAEHTPGGVRPLLGALTTLEALAQGLPEPPDLEMVIAHWQNEAGTVAPTPERIARQVARHFRLDPRALQTRRRQPAGLWPCQVGMFLTRELTGLAWARIGAAFGGRDASTVRHACRKVAERAGTDAGLAADLRRLRAELGTVLTPHPNLPPQGGRGQEVLDRLVPSPLAGEG